MDICPQGFHLTGVVNSHLQELEFNSESNDTHWNPSTSESRCLLAICKCVVLLGILGYNTDSLKKGIERRDMCEVVYWV